jgi:hypothetical protein
MLVGLGDLVGGRGLVLCRLRDEMRDLGLWMGLIDMWMLGELGGWIGVE